MKRNGFFIAFTCLFALAVWSFGGDNSVVSMPDQNPTFEAQASTDDEGLTAKRKQKRKKSRNQQLNEWFYGLSLDEKELLYQLKPEIDKHRRINEHQIRQRIIQRGIAQR